MRRVLPWVLAILLYGTLAPIGLGDVESGALGFVLPILTVVVSIPLLIVLHECAHLLVALLLRLPVVEMRIRLTSSSFVRVRPSPTAPALPPRFVLMHLAGPLANLAIAFALARLASQPVPDVARSCLLTAALLGLILGIGNLLPHRDHRSGLHSDGAQIWRWIVHPARQRELLAKAGPHPLLAHLRDESITDPDLDTLIDAAPTDGVAALARFLRLRRRLGIASGAEPATVANVTIGPETAEDYEWLRTHLLAPAAPQPLVGTILPMLALIPGLGELHRVIVRGATADPTIVTHVGEIAAALAARPDKAARSGHPDEAAPSAGPLNMEHRLVAALDDLLHDRPAEARRRLTDVSPAADVFTGWALLLRATAESALGDQAQTTRLLSTMRRVEEEAGDPPGGEPPPVFAEILAALRDRSHLEA